MPSVLLIHHAARRGDHGYPPNSLPALEHCLAAGAKIVEVDISPLRDVDFLLAHDSDLARFSTGRGSVAELAPRQVDDLRLVWNGEATPHAPALLSQVLTLLGQYDAPAELQLDLKPHVPLTVGVLTRLVDMLRPLRNRVRVTSEADWAIRRLHKLDSDLPLGFDPLLYLGVGDEEEHEPGEMPARLGAFGYWDDHPLATVRWGAPASYLRERAEALWVQAPAGCVWYLDARLALRALDEGFDWIAAWHERGAQVDVWTLDPDRPEQVQMARRLVAAGVDRITTNDPVGLAETLNVEVVY